MRVGLFVPCYVDQLWPRAGIASLELLERFGVTIEFPTAQTCCGQPLRNSGGAREAMSLARRFVEIFAPYDHVVCPSASCVATVRRYGTLLGASAEIGRLERRTHELCGFLVDVLGVREISGSFPHRVGLHASCHGLRELGQGCASESVEAARAEPARELLESIEGVEIASLRRPDECCGFGGAFAVEEAEVSCLMGNDRVDDHRRAGAEILTSTDASCLLHLSGLARRRRLPLRVMHVAEILELASADAPDATSA
jgi:L-lactate dehydrogenase complex protein LldE